MTHLLISKISDPIYDQEWLNKLNKLRIPYEGKYRKGYCIPFVEEVKFYMIRIKKEAVPGLLEVLPARNILDAETLCHTVKTLNGHEASLDKWTNKTKTSRFKLFMLKTGVKALTKLFGLFNVNKVQDVAQKGELQAGHANIFIIGEFKDPVDKEGNEQL